MTTMTEIRPDHQPMVPRIKELLVNALRSGEYKQSVGRMRVSVHSGPDIIERSGIGHCCLGVLTEVAVKEGFLKDFACNMRGQAPLMMVKKWAGLSELAQGHLMKMNDGTPTQPQINCSLQNKDRKTFAEIATWIEHHL